MNARDQFVAAAEKVDQSLASKGKGALPVPDPLPEALSIVGVVLRLATLPALEYDQVRQSEADNLGVRVSTLDKEVATLNRAAKSKVVKRRCSRKSNYGTNPLQGMNC